MTTTTTSLAADLRAAADWLDAHPDLPPVFALHAYPEWGAQISWRGDDALADLILALSEDDGWRSDHRYEDGDQDRIVSGRVSERMSLTVAVVG